MSESMQATEKWSLSQKGHAGVLKRSLYRSFLYNVYPGLDLSTVRVENLADLEDGEAPDRRDTHMCIDVIVSAKMPEEHDYSNHPIKLYFQERFRKAKYARYEDATITVENLSTGYPNELTKTAADYNLYGYVTKTGDVSGIVYETTPVQRAVINETIKYEKKFKPAMGEKQRFAAIPFDAIERHDCVSMRF